MIERIFLPLYLLVFYAGFLLPIPSVILAWREWVKREKTPPAVTWRRVMSLMALLICTTGVALSIFTIAIEWSRELNSLASLPPSSWPISVGSWAAFPAIAISAMAEGKIRRYLLVCGIGLFCFFNWTVGEAI
jgi:hypothetical protein